LIGLTSLWINRRSAVSPELNHRRAVFVLARIDEILNWEKTKEKARELPTEGFKGEVERHLTGKETGLWEIIYFKLFKSQLPVVEKAIETATLMLGTDKSRGYCLEMICADFLAGANLREDQP
jgi:hypothetical protein